MKIILTTLVLSFIILSNSNAEANTLFLDHGNGMGSFSGDINGSVMNHGNGMSTFSGDLNGSVMNHGNGMLSLY